jgi:predicted nucleic acid-binding protein
MLAIGFLASSFMTVLFVDTNVLLYAFSSAERFKQRIARQLLTEDDLVLSVQVLQEFYVQATRPSRVNKLTHDQAAAVIHTLGRYPTRPVTRDVIEAALDTCVRFGIPYWDAAILEAARAAGCHTVLSEDLQHAQDYGGVSVRNPVL